MTSSCSFRITRTAEDLAQTVSSLSQRLVKLEQRQEALELHSLNNSKELPPEEMEMLDGIDELLLECKELLETSDHKNDSDETWLDKEEDLVA